MMLQDFFLILTETNSGFTISRKKIKVFSEIAILVDKNPVISPYSLSQEKMFLAQGSPSTHHFKKSSINISQWKNGPKKQ